MKRNLKYLLLLSIFSISFINAIGCSCPFIKKISAEALLHDGLVFSGTIIELDIKYITTFENKKIPTKKIATFLVDTWFTSQETSDTIIVNTGGNEGNCGLSFNKGEKWLIFADTHNGIIHSSNCTPSISSKKKSFNGSLKDLKKLKSMTGKIIERIEFDWQNNSYTLSGQLKNGKPIGQWVRVRSNDTITINNFNDKGQLNGYQMEKSDEYKETFEWFYETTDSYVKVYWSMKFLVEFYELKNGRRHGKYERYMNNTVCTKANYKNGRLMGDWTSWHEDSAIAKGKIRTMRVFDNDKLLSAVRIDESTGKEIPWPE